MNNFLASRTNICVWARDPGTSGHYIQRMLEEALGTKYTIVTGMPADRAKIFARCVRELTKIAKEVIDQPPEVVDPIKKILAKLP